MQSTNSSVFSGPGSADSGNGRDWALTQSYKASEKTSEEKKEFSGRGVDQGEAAASSPVGMPFAKSRTRRNNIKQSDSPLATHANSKASVDTPQTPRKVDAVVVEDQNNSHVSSYSGEEESNVSDKYSGSSEGGSTVGTETFNAMGSSSGSHDSSLASVSSDADSQIAHIEEVHNGDYTWHRRKRFAFLGIALLLGSLGLVAVGAGSEKDGKGWVSPMAIGGYAAGLSGIVSLLLCCCWLKARPLSSVYGHKA